MNNLQQQIQNYQEQGEAKTGAEANKQIHIAKNATPVQALLQFQSYIRWNGSGYSWGWVLR